MSIIGNIGGQSGGGSLTKSILIVKAPTGSAVAITKGGVTKTAAEKSGEWWFKNLENGTWTITATLGGQSATESFNITQFGVYRKSITYRLTPEFTYSGSYQVVDDNDSPISDFANWKGNWKIRFLTSGTLTFTNLHGFNGLIDLFHVGGGGGGGYDIAAGGGGGGGYTTTKRALSIAINTKYNISIGSGGGGNSSGGTTSAFGITASGGNSGYGGNAGGNGGNGGSGGGYYGGWGVGGSDGGNGNSDRGGKGQGRTTREFELPNGKLYSAGGAGGINNSASAIPPVADDSGAGPAQTPPQNRGGGGGCNHPTGEVGHGASGIAIVRNKR